jgi:hypothetical protein
MMKVKKKVLPVKKLGRPKRGERPVGKDPMMALRMPPEMKAEIEDWAATQRKGQRKVPRSEAIRRLIELGLQSVKKRGT